MLAGAAPRSIRAIYPAASVVPRQRFPGRRREAKQSTTKATWCLHRLELGPVLDLAQRGETMDDLLKRIPDPELFIRFVELDAVTCFSTAAWESTSSSALGSLALDAVKFRSSS